MRIMLLAHFYPPEIGGAAARLHGLARWLAAYGHDVTVVAGFPNYPAGAIPPEYRRKAHVVEELDGVTVRRTWVYATPKRGSIRRLANYFSFMFMAFLSGLFAKGKYDVVIASCPPLFIGLSGWGISLLRRIPFVFDIRDIWPDVAVEAGEFAPDAAITKWGTRLAKFIYNRADHIVPVTTNKKTRLMANGVPEGKLSIVSNGVDLDLVDRSANLRAEWQAENSFVVLYAGLLGIAQKVEVILQAAAKLKDDSEIQFRIVGDGVHKQHLEEMIKSLDLSNVRMVGRLPRDEMPKVLSTADVSVVPLASSNLVDAVPSKMLEAWSYSLPVILVAAGEAADLVHRSNGGTVIAPGGDGSQLADAIRRMKQDRAASRQQGESGHQFVRENLDRPLLAKQMEQVLARVVAEAK